MKDILKPICWGILLLICSLICIFSIFKAYTDITDRYTTAKVNANLSFRKCVEGDLVVLKDHLEIVYLKSDWNPNKDKLVQAITNKIRRRLENCDGCSYLYFSELHTPVDIINFEYRINRITDHNEVASYNQIRNYGTTFSLLNILFFIYLIVALFKFNILKFEGLSLLFLMAIPIAVITTTLATMHPSYEANEIELIGEGLPIVIAIISMFLIYPAIYSTFKSRGYEIFKVLCLSGLGNRSTLHDHVSIDS